MDIEKMLPARYRRFLTRIYSAVHRYAFFRKPQKISLLSKKKQLKKTNYLRCNYSYDNSYMSDFQCVKIKKCAYLYYFYINFSFKKNKKYIYY